jgi:hypothetical protein
MEIYSRRLLVVLSVAVFCRYLLPLSFTTVLMPNSGTLVLYRKQYFWLPNSIYTTNAVCTEMGGCLREVQKIRVLPLSTPQPKDLGCFQRPDALVGACKY